MLTGGIWDSTVQFPPTVNLALYVALWVIALAGLVFVFVRGRAAGFNMRWTTQDILVLAVIGVLLEVYDNLIGDQFITPLLKLLPASDIIHDLALNDIPYMFLLMVGIAVIRKPGTATALVFLNFLLMQLLYGSDKSNVLWWQYGIYQGLLVDMYFALRGKEIFRKANRQAIIDGLIMGALRAVPAVTISAALISPFLNGDTTTFGAIFLNSTLNLIGNGLAAGLLAPLAIRVAQSVNQTAAAETSAGPPVATTPVTTSGAADIPQAKEGGE
jgi:ABC-type cobalt transport system, permease component